MFKEKFLGKYFSRMEKGKRSKGNKTIREYMTQFEQLSRFAYHMIDTPEKKNEKYHQGLIPALK